MKNIANILSINPQPRQPARNVVRIHKSLHPQRRQNSPVEVLYSIPVLVYFSMTKLETRFINGVDVTLGSDNVFADLGLPNAEKLLIKTDLVIEIIKAVRKLGITQEQAAKRMGVTQPKVSGMLRGDFNNLSERKLMDCLNRLGYDIEIKVKPAAQATGHLMIAFA
jgi:predicted XRE-type DNA-binding protein